MGQFTSNCPSCDKKIYWFLDAPKNYECSCGTEVSQEEIIASWDKNYSDHMNKITQNKKG